MRRMIANLQGFFLGIVFLSVLGCESEQPIKFHIDRVEEIGSVLLRDKLNDSCLFELQDDGTWQVNKTYAVREVEFDHFLNTLRQIRIKRPVPNKQAQPLIRAMVGNSTLVEIRNQKGKLIKSYYVGSETDNNRGNYMKLTGVDQLHIVHIPGFEGHLTSRYNTDMNEWRSRWIYKFADTDSIQSIRLGSKEYPNLAFEFQQLGRNQFSLQNLSNGNTYSGDTIDPRKAYSFLNNFSSLGAEAIQNNFSRKEEVMQLPMLWKIEVIAVSGKKKSLEIYPRPATERSRNVGDITGGSISEYDLERYFAYCPETDDFYLIQDFVFGKVLVGYDYFLKEGK